MTPEFVADLTSVLNRHSIENLSNTTDFILAEYLCKCLEAWHTGVERRESWYGQKESPGRLTETVSMRLWEA